MKLFSKSKSSEKPKFDESPQNIEHVDEQDENTKHQNEKGDMKKQTSKEKLYGQLNRAKTSVTNKAKDLEAKIKQSNTYQEMSEKAKDVQAKIRQSSTYKGMMNAISAKKQKINQWIKQQVEKKIVHFVKHQKPLVKKHFIKQGMPVFVMKGVCTLIDEFYPTLVDEVKYQLRLRIHKPIKRIETQSDESTICLPFHKIRVWYNYSTNPIDKSWWDQTKTFSYWLLMIISLIPFYGIQQALYLFAFMCMDKEDEYMLVNYILDYKKQQFLAQGIIAAFSLYFSQFYCMKTWDDSSVKNPLYECVYGSPSSPMVDFYLDFIDFISQLVLIWIAFILLPCSVSKGKADFSDIEEQMKNHQKKQKVVQENENINDLEIVSNDPDYHKKMVEKLVQQKENNEEEYKSGFKGGKLYIFMIYDLLAFSLACGAFFMSWSDIVPKEYHQSSVQFSIAKLVYGGLSLPFLIFKIPYITGLITKARYTSYDENGNTVPDRFQSEIIESNFNTEIDSGDILEETLEGEEDIQEESQNEGDEQIHSKES